MGRWRDWNEERMTITMVTIVTIVKLGNVMEMWEMNENENVKEKEIESE